MVNNKSHKKGGGMFDFFSKKETKEECVAKCDKIVTDATPSTVPNTPSTGTPSTGVTTPDANNKSWIPSWLSFGKKGRLNTLCTIRKLAMCCSRS